VRQKQQRGNGLRYQATLAFLVADAKIRYRIKRALPFPVDLLF
jgi:hypothetical protein